MASLHTPNRVGVTISVRVRLVRPSFIIVVSIMPKTRRPKRSTRKNPNLRKIISLEKLEQRRLLASDWWNPVRPADVNESGSVTPLDAIVVINEIATRQLSDSTGIEPGSYTHLRAHETLR